MMLYTLIFYHVYLGAWHVIDIESVIIEWMDGFPAIECEEVINMSS